MRILHIDDHPRVRALAQDIVSDGFGEQCQFFEGADGAEVIPLYLEHQPDVVLMDFEMAGTDGLSATRELLGRFPEARVIMLSLHDLPNLRSAASEAGIGAFLSKTDIAELPQLINVQVY